MQRQKRRVETDRPQFRRVARGFGDKDVDEGHDHQIGIETGNLVNGGLIHEMRGLQDGQPFFQREFLDRVGRLAVAVRFAIDRDNLVGSRLQQLGEHVLAECLLPHDDQTHQRASPTAPEAMTSSSSLPE